MPLEEEPRPEQTASAQETVEGPYTKGRDRHGNNGNITSNTTIYSRKWYH